MKHILFTSMSSIYHDRNQSERDNAIALGQRVQASCPEKKILIRGITQTGFSRGLRDQDVKFYLLRNMTKDDLESVLNKGEYLRFIEVDDDDILSLPSVAGIPASIQINIRFEQSQLALGTHGEEPIRNEAFQWLEW